MSTSSQTDDTESIVSLAESIVSLEDEDDMSYVDLESLITDQEYTEGTNQAIPYLSFPTSSLEIV